MSDSAANKMMSVSREFGDKSVTLTDLTPSVLYALAAPSTPEEVRTTVAEKVAAGETVSVGTPVSRSHKSSAKSAPTSFAKASIWASWAAEYTFCGLPTWKRSFCRQHPKGDGAPHRARPQSPRCQTAAQSAGGGDGGLNPKGSSILYSDRDTLPPTEGKRIIYLPPSEDDPDWGPRMRFRLTYEGELRPTGGDPKNGQREPLAVHKQKIRKAFHGQLKHLWQVNKFLSEHVVDAEWASKSAVPANQVGGAAAWGGGPEPVRLPLSEAIANMYRENGYRFVPLVREDFSLFCSLDILFLRRDFPAGVVSAGDLDNRIKTLIDALRKPHSANELRGNEVPADDEDPFFCLLEDDDLVTGLSVQTDMLLDPPQGGSGGQSDVKLVISVELKPQHVTMFNLSFA
jgi:hypothetical protein